MEEVLPTKSQINRPVSNPEFTTSAIIVDLEAETQQAIKLVEKAIEDCPRLAKMAKNKGQKGREKAHEIWNEYLNVAWGQMERLAEEFRHKHSDVVVPEKREAKSLEGAEQSLRQSLQWIAQERDRFFGHPPGGSEKKPKLGLVAKKVLAILKRQPKGVGISGGGLVAILRKENSLVSEAYLRRHVMPTLKLQYGVVNLRSAGGYLLSSRM